MAVAQDALFYGLSFSIIPSDAISSTGKVEIQQQIEDNGGILIGLLPDGSIDNIRQLSHVVSTHADFPEYDQALEENVHVVKPSWIQQSLIKRRIAQARQHSPDPALIFQDVVVCFGDLPEGDKDAITAGVMALGGQYSSALTKLVTHIVSLTQDSDKIRLVNDRNLDIKVVLPHWFNDCLMLGKKISDAPYRLPNPEIFDQGSFSTRKTEHNPDLDGALSAFGGRPPRIATPPPSSPTDAATPRKRMNVFTGKSIFFSKDLDILDNLADTFKDLTRRAGGKVVVSVEHADIYIGHFRDGPEYISASREQKVVGNLTWFYYLILHNKWSKPTKKLLHYPVPRGGIPEFKDARISLSNYTGDARTYLENLIIISGGEYTRTMKQDNTHLITAHRKSEKCNAAAEWNINIVNHLWLEESYAACTMQSLTNTRYTHFPPRTNLSEIVGRTEIDPVKVEELYFAEDVHSSPQASAAPAVAASSRKTLPTNGMNGNREDYATPASTRHVSGKENEAPTYTKRASAVKAASSLQRAADDIALFEKEMKRKGGVLHGRTRGIDASAEDVTEPDDVETIETAGRLAKKQRIEPFESAEAQSPVLYRMLLTGDDRWKDKPKKESAERKSLRDLGIHVVTNPVQCNLLCAPRILRTKKFVMAIASAPTIVHPSFVDEALKYHALPDIADHSLEDHETETKWGINLQQSLTRATENDHRLLRGWTVYVTENLTGGFETYKDIIEANGGVAVVYRGRTGVHLPRRRPTVRQDPDAGAESQNQGGDVETGYVYLISSAADAKHWAVFAAMADKQGLEARVVRTDWLLNLAMAQRVVWDDKWLLSED